MVFLCLKGTLSKMQYLHFGPNIIVQQENMGYYGRERVDQDRSTQAEAEFSLG